LLLELHTALPKPVVSVVDVVAGEGAIEEGADAVLVALGREQDEPGLGAGDGELDPALAGSHRLVGDDPAVHFLGPKGERTVLVRDRNPDKLESLDHLQVLLPAQL